MTSVHVLSKTGKPLMPTIRFGRVRRLLKSGQAVIVKHEPFTIQLMYDTPEAVQPVEVCVDAGYQHIGVSVKSEKREYDSQQFDLLPDEKNRHDDCRKYRRTRRNHLRYRKPRYNNRKQEKGWMPPSVQHKYDAHIQRIDKIVETVPVSSITVETAQFDIQALDAIKKGEPIPQGTDYQHGERYGIATLREAVFMRDHYKCQICKKGVKDGAILHVHHALYWKGRHSNRLSELLTVCSKCHTAGNHQKNGKLYGLKTKKSGNFTGATFMNTVKKKLFFELLEKYPDIEIMSTFGAATKCARKELGIEKSHANDAFAMGKFHPASRSETEYFKKQRRNNRGLEKFFDAKYVDIRDGSLKSGKELGCERTKRNVPRNNPKSLRAYRCARYTTGRRSIRKQHYIFHPGTVILVGKLISRDPYISYFGCGTRKRVVTGTHNKCASVQIETKGKESRDVSSAVCKIICSSSGWVKYKIDSNERRKGNSSCS